MPAGSQHIVLTFLSSTFVLKKGFWPELKTQNELQLIEMGSSFRICTALTCKSERVVKINVNKPRPRNVLASNAKF